MKKADFVQQIQEILDREFPSPPIPLNHVNAFTFLIAVLLSARCTDERVNQVTPMLFKDAESPQKMMQKSIEEISEIIQPCGLRHTKAKNIWKLSEILVQEYNGEVPSTFEQLEALPGVGHKTASVVMSQIYKVPAFPVDTHIHRLAKRWGLSSGKNVVQTEKDLKRVFPKNCWNKLHLQIIYFGRKYCPARAHDPKRCPICSLRSKSSQSARVYLD